jgi:hypothetical protein
MVPFNATLLIFGQTEMVGHLPVYGVFLALLVYGSNAGTAAEVRWLPGREDVASRLQPRSGTRWTSREPGTTSSPTTSSAM